VPFTPRNLEEDLEDVGSSLKGARDREFRLAIKALELEQSGVGHQRVPPEGLRSASAPIRDVIDQAVPAMNVSGLAATTPMVLLRKECLPALLCAAAAIEADLPHARTR
jgi:DNA-binding IclR family transcriptional regulator